MVEHVLPARARLSREGERRRAGARSALRVLRKPSRLHLLIAAVLAALLAGGLLWFRSSSFVSVTNVQLSGVSGADARSIEAALSAAAERQSTMAPSVGALEAAVARFHVVRSIAISTSFPHTMAIDVLEQLPVARLSGAGASSAVAADGVVLGPALASRALPKISASFVPATGGTVRSARVREYLSVLGAAPPPLLALVEELYVGREGLTAKMRGGVLVYFGEATRPHAKWASLAAVLANPESKGATYVDVRLPERPAAGISGYTQSGTSLVSASNPSTAALAESLARAVNGQPPVEPPAASTPSSTSGQPPVEPPAASTPSSTSGAAAGTEPGTEAGTEAGTEPGSGYLGGETPSG
ncbi:MAG: cell division protein FtsQ/DivIB [Solirubrobacteraceae bacterium]